MADTFMWDNMGPTGAPPEIKVDDVLDEDLLAGVQRMTEYAHTKDYGLFLQVQMLRNQMQIIDLLKELRR